jgi:hypothetical protein
VGSGLIWDACALLNLLATGREADILGALPGPHHATAIALRETHKLRCPEPGEYETVTLAPLVERGRLVVVTPSDQEIGRFVELAAELDDGEAMALAVAGCRALRLVTDDRKAITTAANCVPPVACLTTAEWMREWATRSRPSLGELADALLRIETRACYAPRATDPLAPWWRATRAGEP